MKKYITPLTDITATLPEHMIALSIINGGEADDSEALTQQYGWNSGDWTESEE